MDVNAGAEAFAPRSGAAEPLLADLGLDSRVVSPREGLGSRLVSDAGSLPSPRGGLLGIPGDPLSPEVRAVVGRWGTLRAWAERFLPAGYGLREHVSVDAYVRARMGRRVAERLVAPVVGGVHSADPATLELDSAQPRLAAAVREYGSLAAAVRALHPTGAARADVRSHAAVDGTRRGTSAGTAVRSLVPSMGELPRAVADQITAHGGALRTNTRVTSLRREDGQWVLEVGRAGRTEPDASTPPEILRADHLVLAVDPARARTLLTGTTETGTGATPGTPLAAGTPLGAIAEALPDAPASPVRLVALAVQNPALDAFPSGTGALVAAGTNAVRAKALTHASAKWEHVGDAARDAIGPGGHVIRLSYGRPGEVLPGDDGLDREQIVDLALSDASAILRTTLDREHLRDAAVITWSRAMTQQRSGHHAALDHLAEVLDRAGLPLELVGTWRSGTGLDALFRDDRRTTMEGIPA
jgi:oxygen-dependent protoporphyrinogen oxidase